MKVRWQVSRYQELVAASARPDLATLGAKDPLDRAVGIVEADSQKIKASLPYDPSLTIDGDYERKHHSHYGNAEPIDRR